jgi:OmcA/MtrC family decaheme c-type cytochrome
MTLFFVVLVLCLAGFMHGFTGFGAAMTIMALLPLLLDFNEVLFPGDRRNCAACHVGNSQNLPVALGAAPVVTPRDYFSPQGPGTAACLGCHDSRDAAAHAYLNTAKFGETTAEACGVCHGSNADWNVDKVHAR